MSFEILYQDIGSKPTTLKILERKEYLVERIINEDDEGKESFWSIGDTYKSEGKTYECDYADMESFILEEITFGCILGATFFGCNLLLAETYCYN